MISSWRTSGRCCLPLEAPSKAVREPVCSCLRLRPFPPSASCAGQTRAEWDLRGGGISGQMLQELEVLRDVPGSEDVALGGEGSD